MLFDLPGFSAMFCRRSVDSRSSRVENGSSGLAVINTGGELVNRSDAALQAKLAGETCGVYAFDQVLHNTSYDALRPNLKTSSTSTSTSTNQSTTEQINV